LRCLRQSSPSPLGAAAWNVVIVTQACHSRFLPRVAWTGAIAQAIENRSNRSITTHLGQLSNQLDHFSGCTAAMVAAPILDHHQLGVTSTGPVQAQMDLRRILVTDVDDDLLQNRPQNALLQSHRRLGMVPQLAKVATELQQALPFSRREFIPSAGG